MFDTLKAFFFVLSFVQTDFSEKIGGASKISEIFFEITFKGFSFKIGIFPHKLHVFMLRVIFEIRIQPVTARGFDDI